MSTVRNVFAAAMCTTSAALFVCLSQAPRLAWALSSTQGAVQLSPSAKNIGAAIIGDSVTAKFPVSNRGAAAARFRRWPDRCSMSPTPPA